MSPLERARAWAGPIAVCLWVPTAAALWWSRQPAPAPDDRRAIAVTAAEREVVLEVMRGNVDSLHAVLAAQAAGDGAGVATAARQAADTPGPAARLASLKRKLPPEWRELGQQVDAGFAAAADAGAAANSQGVTEALASTTAACAACHAGFRLVTEGSP